MKINGIHLNYIHLKITPGRRAPKAKQGAEEPVPLVRPFVPCLSRAPGSPKCLFTGTQSGHGQLCETAVSLPEKAPTHR